LLRSQNSERSQNLKYRTLSLTYIWICLPLLQPLFYCTSPSMSVLLPFVVCNFLCHILKLACSHSSPPPSLALRLRLTNSMNVSLLSFELFESSSENGVSVRSALHFFPLPQLQLPAAEEFSQVAGATSGANNRLEAKGESGETATATIRRTASNPLFPPDSSQLYSWPHCVPMNY